MDGKIWISRAEARAAVDGLTEGAAYLETCIDAHRDVHTERIGRGYGVLVRQLRTRIRRMIALRDRLLAKLDKE